MQTQNTDQIASWLAHWLRKPLLNWWFLTNIGVALVFAIAAFATQTWWLLFIPLLAFVECSAIHFGRVFAAALQHRDIEIERLRRELGTT